MIKNPEKLSDYIAGWMKGVALRARAQSLVVGLSGGVDSAVVYAIAQKTGLPVLAVSMPCHSSPDSSTRAQEVFDTFKKPGEYLTQVNLETAFDSIEKSVLSFYPTDSYSSLDHKNSTEGALRSTLRAPTLDFVAKLYNGLIVGTGNRDEDEVIRYFQKRGDGAVDMSPLAKLFKSEVYQLAKHLGVPESVLSATPSADLLGPDSGQADEKQLGMTYAEIETATRLVSNFFGVTEAGAFMQMASQLEVNKIPVEPRFIEVLRRLAQMEMSSRHKSNPNLPVCDVRDPSMGLVE